MITRGIRGAITVDNNTEEDIKLREKLEEHKGDILRNYELMNLIHLPFKNILEATKCL